MTTYAIAMRTRFRGITERHGMVWQGSVGWAEWSPFEDYPPAEAVPWLLAAREQAGQDFPEPVRDRVPVNCTIPAVPPEVAFRLATESGCGTAKIKVAEPGQAPADDLARVAAVRDALGPDGRIRVDANGAWDVDEAVAALTELQAYDLEYAEQPCATVEDLARLRRRLRGAGILIAADESIRRASDPYRVAELEAADIAVLKVQPLGGVRACLEIAGKIGLPVVVSSAVETSIGIRAGVALAAALPDLPYACGLNTVRLLSDDLAVRPLIAEDGALPVGDIAVDPEAVQRCTAPAALADAWSQRLTETSRLADSEDVIL
ncbi:MAG: o-succinylbenzoate synthase [Microlunatus sp.]|nr:o-succinylbenzoate synthase [Microlunatus sp.]